MSYGDEKLTDQERIKQLEKWINDLIPRVNDLENTVEDQAALIVELQEGP